MLTRFFIWNIFDCDPQWVLDALLQPASEVSIATDWETGEPYVKIERMDEWGIVSTDNTCAEAAHQLKVELNYIRTCYLN